VPLALTGRPDIINTEAPVGGGIPNLLAPRDLRSVTLIPSHERTEMFVNTLTPRARLWALFGVILLALGASRPALAQGGNWQRCAIQDEVCRFNGPAMVRYGADGKYAYKSARNRIICDQQEFGDPAYGQYKQCDYSTDSNQRPGEPPSGEWVPCAAEGETCRFPGVARVRYGTDNRYAYRNANNEIRCSVNVFGDPAYGSHKTCEYQVQEYTGSLRPEGGWEYCASEGGVCNFSGPGEVRYGAKGQFLTRRAINGMPCNVEAFGRDPLYGQEKQCFVRPVSR